MEKQDKSINRIKDASMKVLKKSWEIFKKYYFLIFCVVALIMPELALKSLISSKSFKQFDVLLVNKLFTLGWVIFIVILCVYVLPKKAGRITFITVSSVFIAYSVGQYVYYKIFDQFFWLKSIFLIGEGANYIGDVLHLIDSKLIMCTALAVISVVIASIKWKSVQISKKAKIISSVVPVLVVLASHIYMQPGLHKINPKQWDIWRNPHIIYSEFNSVNKTYEINGLYQFVFRDICSTVFPKELYSEEDFKKVDEFFQQKGKLKENEYTNMFEGKNVIAVMMESMDTWMIDEVHTPTIYKMMNEGIRLDNHNTPLFGVGFTFNSEYAFNTGLYTPASAINASNFGTHAYPYALARLFREKGYTANSYHYNKSSFYSRDVMHRAFGYERYNSFYEFGLELPEVEFDSYMFENDDIYNKMVEKTPFYNFIITYSAHLPYADNGARVNFAKELRPDLVNPEIHNLKNNAQIMASDTDKFFEILLQKLEEDGLLEDTVIIGFTDHYCYGIHDDELVREWKGEDNLHRVPAFIYMKGMEPKTITKPTMTADFAPTIVNLFGLNRNATYIGNDFLDPDNKGFVFLENGDWVDENMYYSRENTEVTAENEEYIAERSNRAKESIEINDIIVLGDYYKKKKQQ